MLSAYGAYNWQIKRVGLIAIKFERTRIHFFKAYESSCQIDINAVHNATVCVDFVKKDSFMGTRWLKIC